MSSCNIDKLSFPHCFTSPLRQYVTRRGSATALTGFEAMEPIRQGMRRHFGTFAKGIAKSLAVQHDHGAQYMSDHFSGGAGAVIRTIEELRQALLAVRNTYNITSLIEQHGFITPEAFQALQTVTCGAIGASTHSIFLSFIVACA
jgi:hypothetical protein